jgi:hypothetical protein
MTEISFRSGVEEIQNLGHDFVSKYEITFSTVYG